MAKNEKRFIVYKEALGLTAEARIIMDKKTGVHYLFYKESYAGGMTPLLGSNGKPFIQKLPESGASNGA